MKVAATPIRAIDSTRPNTMIHGCSCAAPATASTLSSDMVTSAIMICSRAAPKVLRLRPRASGGGSAAVVGRQGRLHLGLGLGLVVGRLLAQFAPHLPAHPQQQQAAGQQQADDGQQLDGDQGEADAQHDGGGQADQDRLLALLRRQGGGGQAHGDGVVAGQHQIDHQHLAERGGLAGEFGGRENSMAAL